MKNLLKISVLCTTVLLAFCRAIAWYEIPAQGGTCTENFQTTSSYYDQFGSLRAEFYEWYGFQTNSVPKWAKVTGTILDEYTFEHREKWEHFHSSTDPIHGTAGHNWNVWDANGQGCGIVSHTRRDADDSVPVTIVVNVEPNTSGVARVCYVQLIGSMYYFDGGHWVYVTRGYYDADGVSSPCYSWYMPIRQAAGVGVTFDVNGGIAIDGVATNEILRVVSQGEQIGELPVPLRWNHAFLGWFTAENGGEQVTASTVATNSMSLYAHWEKWPDVTFNVNGGEAMAEISRSIPKGEQVGELPVPWKWNHVFRGWFTAADGGDEVTAGTVVTSDMTLYAQWETANYEWSYEDNYDGGITITGVSPLTGGITIPSEIDGKRVTAIGERAFSGYEFNAEGFGGVIIPEGVTRLQWQAFAGSPSLEIVELPESLIEIGEAAFSGCKITAIVIPTSVLSISWSAFGGCTNLSTITFEGDEASIDINGSAFKNTALPFSLVVNEGVLIGYRGVCPINLVIGDYAGEVTEIGDGAFRFDDISSITIPASVTNIHWEAFYECQNLSEVVFLGDKNDIDIHESAFAGTLYEASLPFELIIRDGVLTGFTGACPIELTIPNSARVIGPSVFYRSQHPSVDNLERVVFNEGLEVIGDYAFYNCYNLKEIELPSTVTNIEYGAFGACYSITNIVLNEGLISIQDGAFGGGTTTNITLPTTVREVSCGAFRGTDGTVTVHAPWSLWGMLDSGDVYQEYGGSGGLYVVTTRVDVVFYGDMPNFYTVTLNVNGGDELSETSRNVMDGRGPGALPVPTKSGFIFLGWFTAAEGGDEVTAETVVTGAMTLYAHWVKICEVTFDANGGAFEDVDELGNFCFQSEISWEIEEGAPLGNLPWLPICPDDSYFIGWFDDDGNEFTENTVVTNNMTVTARWIVDDGSFKMLVTRGVVTGYFGTCPTELTAADWPEGVTAIGNSAFNGTALTSVVIPSTVTAIGDYAFAWCSDLSSVTFNGDVSQMDISDFAFKGTPWEAAQPFEMIVEGDVVTGYHGTCPATLAAADWPVGVASIGNGAFNGADQLESVSIPAGVTNIGYEAFARCYSLTNATIPASVKAIGDYAFSWSSLAAVTFVGGEGNIADLSDYAFWDTPYERSRPFSMIVDENRIVVGYHGTCPATLAAADWPVGVTAIGNSVFNGAALTSVVIPSTVTAIGDYAFAWCSDLSSVTFNGDVSQMDISDFAFKGTPWEAAQPFEMIVEGDVVTGYHGTCPATLTAADWPVGVTEIGDSVFYNASQLESVSIPAGVTNIGYGAFASCYSLTNATISASVEAIYNYAFERCYGLSTVTFNGDVSQIDIADSAFDGTPWAQDNMPTVLMRCDEYGNETENGTTLGGYHGADPVTLDIPADVTVIRDWAFNGCNTLQELTVPTNVTEIGDCAFASCCNLARAFLPKALEGVIDESSVFYDSPVTVYYYEGSEPTFATVTLDPGEGSVDMGTVRVIPGNAIGTLPTPTLNGYEFLGWFTAAEGGDEVTAETVVTGDMMLYAHWEEIIYTYNYIDNGDGTVTLSRYDEYGWWVSEPIRPMPVGEFTVPNEINGKRVVAIGNDVFDGYEMTSVVIPAGVTNMCGATFSSASGLTNITVAASNPAYKDIDGVVYTKDGKTLVAWPRAKGGDAVVAPGTESIGDSAFYCNGNLTSVSLPTGLQSIGNSAFAYCQNGNFISVTIPASMEMIGTEAFKHCSYLSTVNFLGTEGDIDIATTAFISTPYDAIKPFALIIDYGTLVGFHGVAPENVVISNYLEGVDLTGIGSAALSAGNYNTASMTNVVVPEGVTWIGDYAFASDEALESVTLPESLQSISYNAFYWCTALRELRIPPVVDCVSDTLFEGCTNLTVYAPETLRDTFSVPEGCTIEYYEVPQYTVTFDANGGMIDGEPTLEISIYEGRFLGIEGYDEWGSWGWGLPTPTFNGREFLGWFTAAEGGDEATTETVVTSNMTLYAHWEATLPAPDNDDFANATMISGASGSVTGTNLGASVEEDEPLDSMATVWWRWTAPTNGTFAFSTQGSDFDTVLGVYTGSAVDELDEVDSDDDSFEDGTSAVTFDAVMGTTYYIAVGGYDDYTGSIVLCWGVDDVIVDVGGGKTVTVPGTWLEDYDTLWDDYGGDKATYANSTAVNGRKVWECYVLDLDPELDDDFTIVSFPMNADGTPDLENIEFYPPQDDWNVPAQPVVKGAATLDGEWQTVTEQNKSSLRFFKVEVELP